MVECISWSHIFYHDFLSYFYCDKKDSADSSQVPFIRLKKCPLILNLLEVWVKYFLRILRWLSDFLLSVNMVKFIDFFCDVKPSLHVLVNSDLVMVYYFIYCHLCYVNVYFVKYFYICSLEKSIRLYVIIITLTAFIDFIVVIMLPHKLSWECSFPVIWNNL
jgi:hypothetical protein